MKQTRDALRGELIRGALSGQDLQRWLPSGDFQAARSAAVAGQGGGSMEWGSTPLWYQISPKGIGAYSDTSNMRDPKAAVEFVKWREIADAMARVPKYLVEELERTGEAWMAWNHEWNYTAEPDKTGWTDAQRKERQQERMRTWRAVQDPYAAARQAVIEVAMERPSLEPTLF